MGFAKRDSLPSQRDGSGWESGGIVLGAGITVLGDGKRTCV